MKLSEIVLKMSPDGKVEKQYDSSAAARRDLKAHATIPLLSVFFIKPVKLIDLIQGDVVNSVSLRNVINGHMRDMKDRSLEEALRCCKEASEHLEQIPSVKTAGHHIMPEHPKMTDGVLGLLMIPELKSIRLIEVARDVQDIVNKYLDAFEPSLVDCQHELIEAGYEEVAKI